MNIQKIFSALQDDDDNSGLGIICNELEIQGYFVKIDNIPVKANEIFEGKQENLENKLGPLDIVLIKNEQVEQEFSIEFTEFHEIIFKQKQ